jgi:hypothetical protein
MSPCRWTARRSRFSLRLRVSVMLETVPQQHPRWKSGALLCFVAAALDWKESPPGALAAAGAVLTILGVAESGGETLVADETGRSSPMATCGRTQTSPHEQLSRLFWLPVRTRQGPRSSLTDVCAGQRAVSLDVVAHLELSPRR